MFNELHAFPAALYGGFNSWTIQAAEKRASEEKSTQSRVIPVTVIPGRVIEVTA